MNKGLHHVVRIPLGTPIGVLNKKGKECTSILQTLQPKKAHGISK